MRHLWRLWVILAGLALATPAWAVNFNISGTLPRNLSAGSFTVTVQVVGVTAAQVAAGRVDRTPTNRLFMYLPQSVGGTNVPAAASSTRVTTGMPYYVTITTSTPDTGTPNGSNFDFVYQVTFWYLPGYDAGGKNSPASLAAKSSPGAIQVGAAFYLGGTGSNNQIGSNVTSPTSIQQANYIATEVPRFATTAPVVGSMEQITVTWDVVGQVAVTGSTGRATPSSVNVFVVDADLTSRNLPGYLYKGGTSGTTDNDTAATCSYTQPTTVFSTCVKCPADGTDTSTNSNYYLSTSDIAQNIPGIQVQSAPASAGALTVNGLKNNHQYVVFLQYDTPSVTPSAGQQCVIGVPSPNYTLAELNGEPGGRTVDFRCMVATAAYGTTLHKDLSFFRKFRDRLLLTNPLGRQLVAAYYRYSPPVAAFISRHEWARSLVRGLLWAPASVLEAVNDWY